MYITFLMFGTTSAFSLPGHRAKHSYTPAQSDLHRIGSTHLQDTLLVEFIR